MPADCQCRRRSGARLHPYFPVPEHSVEPSLEGAEEAPFARGSATYCFATVMAAAGVEGADDEPFESWLAAHCTVGGHDDLPGTVLVWRDAHGNNTHAAVTLGGGWALQEPGQEWFSPHQVLTVRDLSRLAPPGVVLHRYYLQDAAAHTSLEESARKRTASDQPRS